VNRSEKVSHTLQPVFNRESRILMLGSIPSPLSRENGFYYGHPRNRFWQVLAIVFNEMQPITNEEKAAFVLRNHIALWDVLAECEIVGASDSSIKNPIPNDLEFILTKAPIKQIFTTGKKAGELYQKYIYPKTNLPCIVLPSTSPANAAYSVEKLVEHYCVIKKYIQ